MMAASKPTFHMYVISLYHLCRYVFVLMLTEHAQARPQFSNKLSAASQTLRRPQCGRDIDLTVIFKSGRILSSSFRCAILYFVNPNPFHYAEQIDWCALLGIRQLRHLYLSRLPHARSLYNDGCSSNST